MQTCQDPPKIQKSKKDHPLSNTAILIKEKGVAHPTMLCTMLHKAEATEGTPGAPKSMEEPQQQDATDPMGNLQQDQANLWVYCRCLPSKIQEYTNPASIYAMMCSRHKPSANLHSLFGLGLKFYPTPRYTFSDSITTLLRFKQ
eukprot:15335605-Ditylum_brightwellii.AAC.1